MKINKFIFLLIVIGLVSTVTYALIKKYSEKTEEECRVSASCSGGCSMGPSCLMCLDYGCHSDKFYKSKEYRGGISGN